MQPDNTNTHLWKQILELPYFRGTLRAVEARWLEHTPLPGPVLDVGSGDGHFAARVFSRPLDVGVDPSRRVMPAAKKYAGYKSLVQADGARLPFPDNHFASAVSNSVLEHIPHLDAVLPEVQRVLQPGAPFVFTVPNPGYRTELDIPRRLRRFRLRKLADKYTQWFMKITRTINLGYEAEWTARLHTAGFEIEKTFRYFSPAALKMLEWGHYWGFPCVIAAVLTNRWILAPYSWNLALTERYARRFYEEEPDESGTYSYYLARKRSS